MNQPLIECVPNFSEGRRMEVIERIVAAIIAVPGVLLLDVHRDADHNRSVVTFAGAPPAVLAGAFAGVAVAQRLIDLDDHWGTHPRIGAADVVPFVPLHGATMQQCVALAQQLGQQIGDQLGVPVYLYEAAATRPSRRNLADVRHGGYEGLKETIATDPARAPDFGPAHLTPAGATLVGARSILIAYNVFLNTADSNIARRIARAIRERDGGLPHVRALGMLVNGRAQVSMNLTNYRETLPAAVWDRIAAHAAQHGAAPVEPEIVGLLPAAAVPPLDRYPAFANIARTQTLEARLAEKLKAEQG
jgi:glutamate formiminotransferase